MSYRQQLHAAHKARLQRMVGAAKRSKHLPQATMDAARSLLSAAQPNAQAEPHARPPKANNAWLLALLRKISAERRPTVFEIKSVVAKAFRLSIVDLDGDKRSRKYVLPRMIAMHLACRLTERSLTHIGMRLGGRDHAAAHYANQRMLDRRKQDSNFDAQLSNFERRLISQRPSGTRTRQLLKPVKHRQESRHDPHPSTPRIPPAHDRAAAKRRHPRRHSRAPAPRARLRRARQFG